MHAGEKYIPDADITLSIDVSCIPLQPEYRKIYVKKRPYVDEFLREVSKHFEVVMFTASVERYAVPLFERLDPKGNIIDSQLFR